MEGAPAAADHGAMENERGAARQLVRRTDDRMLAGVCSGLADHFGTDPLLFRLGFVVFTLLGFTGVVAYAVAWALIPADVAGARNGRGGSVAGVVLLVIAGLAALPALLGFLNAGFPPLPGDLATFRTEPLAFAAVFVVAGLVLLRPREEREQEPAADTAETRVLPARPARVRRQRSGLTPITLAVVLLVGGITGFGSGAGWIGLDVGQVAALSLLLVGAGLIVGAWWGRARLLIAVGIVMVPVVLAASVIDFPVSGTIGSPYLHLSRAGTLDDMEVLVGQATLDLADYPFREGIETARLRVAAGAMTVVVPHDVRVEVRATVEGGEAHVLGGFESGYDLDVTEVAGPKGATKALHLDIDAGLGSVGVYRMNDPRPGRDRRGRDEKPRREEKRRGDERTRRDGERRRK